MVLVLWYYLRLLINDQSFLCVLKAFSFQVKEIVYVYLRTLVERLPVPFMTCLVFSDFRHSHCNSPHIFTLGETSNHLEPTLNSNNTNNVGFLWTPSQTLLHSMLYFNVGKGKENGEGNCNPNRIQLVKIPIYQELTSISRETINRIMTKLFLDSIKIPSINFLCSWDDIPCATMKTAPLQSSYSVWSRKKVLHICEMCPSILINDFLSNLKDVEFRHLLKL